MMIISYTDKIATNHSLCLREMPKPTVPTEDGRDGGQSPAEGDTDVMGKVRLPGQSNFVQKVTMMADLENMYANCFRRMADKR